MMGDIHRARGNFTVHNIDGFVIGYLGFHYNNLL